MPNLRTEIGVFLWSFISHWQSYVTGGVVTGLIQVYERLTARALSKQAYFLIFVVTFSMAGFFMAWREQYERAESAEARLTKPQNPTIQVTVPPISVPPAQVVINPSLPSAKTLPSLTVASDRHVSTEQRVAIKRVLATFPAQTLGIAAPKGRDERIAYAKELVGAFADAGWSAINYCVAGFKYDAYGLLIVKHAQSNMPDVTPVRRALEAARIVHQEIFIKSAMEYPTFGVPCEKDRDSNGSNLLNVTGISTGTLVLFVGPKIRKTEEP